MISYILEYIKTFKLKVASLNHLNCLANNHFYLNICNRIFLGIICILIIILLNIHNMHLGLDDVLLIFTGYIPLTWGRNNKKTLMVPWPYQNDVYHKYYAKSSRELLSNYNTTKVRNLLLHNPIVHWTCLLALMCCIETNYVSCLFNIIFLFDESYLENVFWVQLVHIYSSWYTYFVKIKLWILTSSSMCFVHGWLLLSQQEIFKWSCYCFVVT